MPKRSLIGKPSSCIFPHDQARSEWGGKVTYVRVPDFERVRFIR